MLKQNVFTRSLSLKGNYAATGRQAAYPQSRWQMTGRARCLSADTDLKKRKILSQEMFPHLASQVKASPFLMLIHAKKFIKLEGVVSSGVLSSSLCAKKSRA